MLTLRNCKLSTKVAGFLPIAVPLKEKIIESPQWWGYKKMQIEGMQNNNANRGNANNLACG
ncbi:hypothetical protein GCM10008018_26940 [Paenibacillus marchantiophytorum]|uniref:Uncharacterized protein n=1 Tax=Paenibacillus marchantiophytorum TaxID=1619310 RepID=A0ABQ1EP41_9BACL|nr:hypothetical protein GCM10008018_26940 [Paenibacillus marchantiophytorum]